MLAWTSVLEWTEIYWARGYIATSGPNIGKWIISGSYVNTGYWGWQSPTLATQSNTSYPWLIGFKQGSAFYTARYRTSTNAFTDIRAAFSNGSSGILSGALAEFFYGGYREMHVKGVTD